VRWMSRMFSSCCGRSPPKHSGKDRGSVSGIAGSVSALLVERGDGDVRPADAVEVQQHELGVLQ
jgi:hypothetical protein